MAWPIPRAAPVTRATLLARSTFIALRQDRMNNVAEDVRQAVIAAAVAIGQLGVVDAHQMQNGRVQVVDMHAIFDSVPAVVVGVAVGHAALDAATGQPYGEAEGVMLAAVGAFRRGRAAELTAPDDQ